MPEGKKYNIKKAGGSKKTKMSKATRKRGVMSSSSGGRVPLKKTSVRRKY